MWCVYGNARVEDVVVVGGEGELPRELGKVFPLGERVTARVFHLCSWTMTSSMEGANRDGGRLSGRLRELVLARDDDALVDLLLETLALSGREEEAEGLARLRADEERDDELRNHVPIVRDDAQFLCAVFGDFPVRLQKFVVGRGATTA